MSKTSSEILRRGLPGYVILRKSPDLNFKQLNFVARLDGSVKKSQCRALEIEEIIT